MSITIPNTSRKMERTDVRQATQQLFCDSHPFGFQTSSILIFTSSKIKERLSLRTQGLQWDWCHCSLTRLWLESKCLTSLKFCLPIHKLEAVTPALWCYDSDWNIFYMASKGDHRWFDVPSFIGQEALCPFSLSLWLPWLWQRVMLWSPHNIRC